LPDCIFNNHLSKLKTNFVKKPIMEIAIKISVGLVAFIHAYITLFEMFFWEARGPKIFKNFELDLFPKTKALALNMGLYNGFLAAGLIWTFFISDPIWQTNISLFFLGCVFVAGCVGAISAKPIFFVQSVPALVAIVLILLNCSCIV